jgi:hypothetical protein
MENFLTAPVGVVRITAFVELVEAFVEASGVLGDLLRWKPGGDDPC